MFQLTNINTLKTPICRLRFSAHIFPMFNLTLFFKNDWKFYNTKFNNNFEL